MQDKQQQARDWRDARGTGRGAAQRRLREWQEKLTRAMQHCAAELSEMDLREALYAGTREIRTAQGATAHKRASHTRNIIFELVESQVDSTVPIPKVEATCPHCEALARSAEQSLRADVERLPFVRMNDEQERTVPIQGASYFLVEWDNRVQTHETVGDLRITLLHPRQVIVQPGCTRIEEADYLFVLRTTTRQAVRARFGVEVREDGGYSWHVHADDEDRVTQVLAYYRHEDGIGLFSFVGDTVLIDLADYQARRVAVCDRCGATRAPGAQACACGSRSFTQKQVREEVLPCDVVRSDGTVLPAGTRLPYYKPGVYPLILRKNVSVHGRLLGDSDVDKVRDQQMLINKLGTKIEEKLLKGGSYVTLPRGVHVRRDESELKVIDVASPAEASMIAAINLQPNISYDSLQRDKAYEEAKSTLGVTDTYQGKPDNTATSGKAKQLQIQQSAGRLLSKRKNKQISYADLFRVMFAFKLAYADEARPYAYMDGHGCRQFGQFSRYDFLRQDEAGQWYYADAFLFSVDESGSLGSNREAMWQETRMNFQQGAFGPVGSREALLLFWEVMQTLQYPRAQDVYERLLQQDAGAQAPIV